jgi:hypothetical protein
MRDLEEVMRTLDVSEELVSLRERGDRWMAGKKR